MVTVKSPFSPNFGSGDKESRTNTGLLVAAGISVGVKSFDIFALISGVVMIGGYVTGLVVEGKLLEIIALVSKVGVIE